MRKKVFSMLLVLACTFAMIPGLGVPVSAETKEIHEIEIWDGSVSECFAGGNGTSTHPFIIKTASQLAFLAKMVNDGNSCEGIYLKLANDLYLNDPNSLEAINNGTEEMLSDMFSNGNSRFSELENINLWPVIGNTSENSFSGNFDGGSFTINGLVSMDEAILSGNPDTSTKLNCTGLFGYIKSADIKNLKFDGSLSANNEHAGILAGFAESSTISGCYIKNSFVAAEYTAGGLVSQLSSTKVDNCSIEAIISISKQNAGAVSGIIEGQKDTDNTVIANCFSDSIIAGGSIIGGIVGNIYAGNVSIDNCTNANSITGSSYIAGIVGMSSGENVSMFRCSNRGAINGLSVVGGIAGGYFYRINECYNAGIITGSSEVGGIAGGIVDDGFHYSRLSNCFNYSNIYADRMSGGLLGSDSSCIVEYCYSSGMVIPYSENADISSLNALAGSIYPESIYYLSTDGRTENPHDLSGEALTPDQMRNEESFHRFDFYNVWEFIDEEINPYPVLRYIDFTPGYRGILGMVGDVNSDGGIDEKDIIILMRYIGNWKVDINLDLSDIDGNGVVDDVDAVKFARFYANWKIDTHISEVVYF